MTIKQPMMNWLLRYKEVNMNVFFKRINTLTFVKASLVVLFLFVLAANILLLQQEEFFLLSIAFLIISSVILTISIIGLVRYSKRIKQMGDLAKLSAGGSLYHRMTDIDKSEEIGTLAWNINNMLDQFEAFSRDMDTSLKMISEGKTYRKMMPSGLHGDFVRLSNNINEALETIAVAQSKDEFIQEMLKTLDEYTAGVYTSKIDLTNMQEDIIALAKGINALGDSLSELSQVNLKNGLALKQGSDVLSKNVKQLSDSATTQAASLEETAAALEEVTENMRESTNNTMQMAQYAQEVTTSANEGERLAKKTTLSMDEINEQTSLIHESITVIDQIAFQTNILSLNAAVEAATAGEAGKGFAVVAQEVRNLASRSAEAAKEIKDIVEAATLKANEGKKIADEMISGYNQLNSNITATIELIENVTASTKEQEQGIIQINDAIALLDKQTQESASVAHETNIVAQQSSDIAERIVQEANKEFHGKDDIKVRKDLVNPNYKGVEKRSIERRMKNNEF